MNEWLVVLGAGGVSILLRLAPEVWLRGREPPGALARALPWLPVVVAGALAGVLHVDVPEGTRVTEYAIAAVPAALTLLVRRSFYLPLVTGALTLALVRALGIV